MNLFLCKNVMKVFKTKKIIYQHCLKSMNLHFMATLLCCHAAETCPCHIYIKITLSTMIIIWDP